MGTRSTLICSFSALLCASSSSISSFRLSLSSESSVSGGIPDLNQPRVMRSMPKARVKPTQTGEQLPREIFKGYPPLRLSNTLAATGCRFCRVPSGMHEVDWHNPPCRKLVIWLTGEVEFETSDGDVRRVAAGSVVLAEDTTGKGHISRHPPDGQLQVMVDLDLT